MKLPAFRTSLVHGFLLPVAMSVVAMAGPAQAAKQPKSPVTTTAQDAFWWGDFAAIEKQNAYFKQPGRFNEEGASQLSLFRKGIEIVFDNDVENTEAYLKEMDALTLQWASENPKSALAHILHAHSLVDHGWSYRGGGYAKDVPEQAWKDFYAYLWRAATYLKDHADVALTDSYAHIVLLRIGRGLGWEEKQMAAIANEGLARNPDDIELYFAVSGHLLPKWGGNAKALNSFIQHATKQTREKFGLGMYARLYSAAADDQFGQALFENSHADWDKMKQGFEDMLTRYPNGPLRRNRYAYMACIAKDKPTLLKLLGEVGTKFELSEWGDNPERSLELCKRWATQL